VDFGTKWLKAQEQGGTELDVTPRPAQRSTSLKKVFIIETTSGDGVNRDISSSAILIKEKFQQTMPIGRLAKTGASRD
jgi:hypothetical protein